ncbi:MAG: hypothetical protein IJ007_06370 [Oscillospiraceae bacterium]|nr:hypothetical protein [Oscillospiraceae bacterium]
MKLFYLLLFGIPGVVFIGLAAINAEWYFSYLEKTPLFRRFGRTGSRVLVSVTGLLLVLYGSAVFFEWI